MLRLNLDFPYDNPTSYKYTIQEIAHRLARIPRWCGAGEFLSVADHSVNVCAFVSLPVRAFALLHDAAEAYMMDLPSPLKVLLPEYRQIEKTIQAEILSQLLGGSPTAVQEVEIHGVDAAVAKWERDYMEQHAKGKRQKGAPFVLTAFTDSETAFLSEWENQVKRGGRQWALG